MDRSDEAVQLFLKGFSCSQAVFSAYCKDLGLDAQTGAMIAAPFRAGMGRMGRTCGALTGAFMVLGLKFGDSIPGETEKRDRICALVQEMDEEFTTRNGSSVCNVLVGCDISSPEQRAKAAERGVFKTLCPKFVRDAAEIAGAIISRE